MFGLVTRISAVQARGLPSGPASLSRTTLCCVLIDEAQCRRCAGGKKEGKWQWIVAGNGIIGAGLVWRRLHIPVDLKWPVRQVLNTENDLN